jgi:hypothetical protein
MQICNFADRTAAELEQELAAGARVVFYEYCVSVVIMTLRRPSALYLLRPGERGLLRGLPYTIASLLVGWWGVPWGCIYTPLIVFCNFGGGRDVTAAVQASLRTAEPATTS